MTSAARRRKAGRPRKTDAKRYPSGDPIRPDNEASRRENYVAVAYHTLAARCRRMGWRPTNDAMLEARDPRLETFIGCLAYSGRIPERAYLGLTHYADLRARWLRSIDAPREWPNIGSYGEPVFGGIAPEIDGEAAKRVASAHLASEAVILALGLKGSVWAALTVSGDVKVRDYSEEACETLKKAGLALARHFGV